jgi:hypothetical protein
LQLCHSDRRAECHRRASDIRKATAVAAVGRRRTKQQATSRCVDAGRCFVWIKVVWPRFLPSLGARQQASSVLAERPLQGDTEQRVEHLPALLQETDDPAVRGRAPTASSAANSSSGASG